MTLCAATTCPADVTPYGLALCTALADGGQCALLDLRDYLADQHQRGVGICLEPDEFQRCWPALAAAFGLEE